MEKVLKNKKQLTIYALIASAILFVVMFLLVRPNPEEGVTPSGDYAEYENGKIVQILSDNTYADEASDGGMRGEQMMLVEVTTGQYKGETFQVYNYVGPLYGQALEVGDSCTMIISTYENGDISATVYEYNRLIPIIVIVALFMIATILVGGKSGAKSLLGLTITILCLFFILLPALMKGAPTLLTTFLICVYVAAVSFIIIGGVDKKTICATLGTIAGMGFAFLFSIFAQWLLKIDGLRVDDVEALLQLRQMGTPIGLKGLLSAQIMISSLGAVMDVAMSLSSSLQEIHEANPKLSPKELTSSGMNIGRDMVGTMTNTLILAFIGSGLVLILYIYSLGLSPYQLLSSSFIAIEIVSGISSSIGVILSVPVTTLIASYAYGKKNN